MELLRRFLEFSVEVAETPIVRQGRQVSTSLGYDFATGTMSHTVTLPDKAEIQALLHVMRPSVLHNEPTAFNRIINILERRIDDRRVRASFGRQSSCSQERSFSSK